MKVLDPEVRCRRTLSPAASREYHCRNRSRTQLAGREYLGSSMGGKTGILPGPGTQNKPRRPPRQRHLLAGRRRKERNPGHVVVLMAAAVRWDLGQSSGPQEWLHRSSDGRRYRTGLWSVVACRLTCSSHTSTCGLSPCVVCSSIPVLTGMGMAGTGTQRFSEMASACH